VADLGWRIPEQNNQGSARRSLAILASLAVKKMNREARKSLFLASRLPGPSLPFQGTNQDQPHPSGFLVQPSHRAPAEFIHTQDANGHHPRPGKPWRFTW